MQWHKKGWGQEWEHVGGGELTRRTEPVSKRQRFSSDSERVECGQRWKFDESKAEDYALSAPKLRATLRASMAKTPLTEDKFFKSYQDELGSLFPKLVKCGSSHPKWRTILKMWILHSNFRDGMQHLLVGKPKTNADNQHYISAPTKFMATPKRYIYTPDNILTRCFIENRDYIRLRDVKVRKFEDIVKTFLLMSSYQKQQVDVALLPIWQPIFSKKLLQSCKIEPNFESLKSVLYAKRMDKIMVPYMGKGANDNGGMNWHKSLQLLETDLLSIYFNPTEGGVWTMKNQVDPGMASRLGIGYLNEESQMYTVIHQLRDNKWRIHPGSSMQSRNKRWFILFDKVDFYKWLYTLERSVIPEQLVNPKCILLQPLLKIVFSFLLGGGG